MTRRILVPLMACFVAAGVLSAPATATSGGGDEYRGRQWGLTRIKAPRAWAESRGKGTIIAIVDTGVDLGHPDLARNVLAAKGKDVVDGDADAQDENGHGTHVAGIAAAVAGNGIGIAGVAPRAKILPVRVLDADGSGSVEGVAAGIRYAAEHGADVVNLSLGFGGGIGIGILDGLIGGDLGPIHDAISFAISKGAVVVVAAGNDSVDVCDKTAADPMVLCVGSSTRSDTLSSFSNKDGSMKQTYLVAPGGDGETCDGDIFSTVLRTAEHRCSPEAGYAAYAGTSMATPMVAGVAAMLVAEGMNNKQIVRCITKTADDLGADGRDGTFGYGRLNALRAVKAC
ncbi:MAG TPA: S8 family serine peptidase [Actinomycetota bacterium]|nr:S8 family serine peptidase [Actinomycetota bacterium]